MIQIHDNWHPDPGALRTLAVSRPFGDIEQGGARFPGFQRCATNPWPAFAELLNENIEVGDEAFRIYLAGQAQPTTIHQDSSMSRYSAILYLDPAEQGSTAFYRKTPTGFEETVRVRSTWNRLVVFDSNEWHGRFPLNITDGTTPETGRLIQVFFFSPSL